MTANNGCSIPSDLALELKTNPFLRCDLLRDSLKDCKMRWMLFLIFDHGKTTFNIIINLIVTQLPNS